MPGCFITSSSFATLLDFKVELWMTKCYIECSGTEIANQVGIEANRSIGSELWKAAEDARPV